MIHFEFIENEEENTEELTECVSCGCYDELDNHGRCYECGYDEAHEDDFRDL